MLYCVLGITYVIALLTLNLVTAWSNSGKLPVG